MKFIYVFDKEAKERMLEMGYKLMQSNEDKKTYVFLNDSSKKELRFSAGSELFYVESNTISF